jgi:Holliday junction resolvase RusA-like endonuclease
MNELTLSLTLPKTVSLNTLYAGKHWTFRKKTKDEYKKIVEAELARYDHHFAESMSIHIRYNTRADVDNLVLVSKFTADTLVANGWITDDSPKYYHRLTITFDKSVEKNYCEVEVRLTNATLQE